MSHPTGTDAVPAPVPTPGRIGQGTAVAQARAAAEVIAATQAARQFPRSMQGALAQMRESCSTMYMAQQAFYRFPRGGTTVSGPSIHLARELARCFGHIRYEVVELRRDDEYGQSEMQAWAEDVQNGTRAATTWIVVHTRDTKKGPVKLVDLRDVYERNANEGSRRVRSMILAILPPQFVEEAIALCNRTLEHGGGVPLATRRANAVAAFADKFGVTGGQLVRKVGREVDDWTAYDVAQLVVMFQSLERRDLLVEDEFPPDRVTMDEIVGRGVPPQAAAPVAVAEEEGDEPPPGYGVTPAEQAVYAAGQAS